MSIAWLSRWIGADARERRTRRFERRRCLITGASSGIGRAVARQLANEGASLILTGRCRARLDQLVAQLVEDGVPADRAIIHTADLTVADERAALMERVDREWEALDLLVNAAGVGAYGPFVTHDSTVLRRLLEINVVAVSELCRLSHPLLCQGDQPTVVNLGSIVARRGLPGRSEYAASKFAVAGLTESLRAEWSYDGIQVILFNPGFTATPFEQNVVVDTAHLKTASWRQMSAETVAEALLSAVRRGCNESTLTGQGRWLLRVNRLAPRFVDAALGRWTRKLYRRSGVVPRRGNADRCPEQMPLSR